MKLTKILSNLINTHFFEFSNLRLFIDAIVNHIIVRLLIILLIILDIIFVIAALAVGGLCFKVDRT